MGAGVSGVPIELPPRALLRALSPLLCFLAFGAILSATAMTSIFCVSLPPNFNLLIIASRRSSCARRAFKTCQTTL